MTVPWLERIWYHGHPLAWLLLPLSGLFWVMAAGRRLAYRFGLLRQQRLPVPVIVVGNISVGGTGKTPLVIWLAHFLKQQGWRPGIIARGYGGKAGSWPQQVRPDSDPVMVGDEPVLLARRTGCPVCVGPDRVAAGRELLRYAGCDLILTDDGLQHYRLGRNLEIAVLDGKRGLGNGFLLPAGPLREGAGRLRRVDAVVVNGERRRGRFGMRMSADDVQPVAGKAHGYKLAHFAGKTVHSVAGIGHPQRFFDSLRRAGIHIEPHLFADHHGFQAADIDFGDEKPVLMTEKDAVKCQRFADHRHWQVRVSAEPEPGFSTWLKQQLKGLRNG